MAILMLSVFISFDTTIIAGTFVNLASITFGDLVKKMQWACNFNLACNAIVGG